MITTSSHTHTHTHTHTYIYIYIYKWVQSLLSLNGHKTSIQKDNVSKKEKKKKRYINSHYIPHKNKTLPLTKSLMLTLPLSTWLLST